MALRSPIRGASHQSDPRSGGYFYGSTPQVKMFLKIAVQQWGFIYTFKIDSNYPQSSATNCPVYCRPFHLCLLISTADHNSPYGPQVITRGGREAAHSTGIKGYVTPGQVSSLLAFNLLLTITNAYNRF